MSNTLLLRLLNLDMPKLWLTRKFDLSTLHLIGISEFAISRILMQLFQDFSPRKPEMVCHLSTHQLLWPHTILDCRDITFANSYCIVYGTFTHKTPIRDIRIDPMALVAQINGPAPPWLRTFWEYTLYLPCSFVRSNGSQRFANSPQRIPTVRSSLVIPANDQVFFHKLFHLRLELTTPSYKLHGTTSLHCPSTNLKALSFLSFLVTSSLEKDSCTHSLWPPSNTSSA
jgi:hypothetical protein